MQAVIDNNNFELMLETLDSATIESSPNLLLAALFWEEARREAALLCYNRMRQIDDLVDDAKSVTGELNDSTKLYLTSAVNDWLTTILEGRDKELDEVIKTFKVPAGYWEAFANSMLYDVVNTGFKTIADFIKYAEGAAVAPASLFMHFCGLTKRGNSYIAPAFNCKEIARPCALFSYLVHIIRDFQKDQLNHLNYFATDILQTHKLDPDYLLSVAKGVNPSANFRKMMGHYKEQAAFFRLQTLGSIQKVAPFLLPEYKISIEVIFALYDSIYNKIDTHTTNFTTQELIPEHYEIRNLLMKSISASHPH